METYNKVMTSLLVVITILMVASLTILLTNEETPTVTAYVDPMPLMEPLLGPIKYNCEKSDGLFQNGACICPSQSNDDMYDEATGYCQSEFGGPAGDALAASIGLPYGDYKHYQRIVRLNCEQSGGEFLTARCNCSEDQSYNLDTGLCMDSFGIPGGELGETAKKLQEFKTLQTKDSPNQTK